MKLRYATVCLVGLVAFANSGGQPPAPEVEVAPLGIGAPPGPITPPVREVPTPPTPPSVEQLVSSIAAVQAKKAALEKEEQALRVELKKRMQELKTQMDKLGITEEASKATKVVPDLRPRDSEPSLSPPPTLSEKK
jgi:hypothetical protein